MVWYQKWCTSIQDCLVGASSRSSGSFGIVEEIESDDNWEDNGEDNGVWSTSQESVGLGNNRVKAGVEELGNSTALFV